MWSLNSPPANTSGFRIWSKLIGIACPSPPLPPPVCTYSRVQCVRTRIRIYVIRCGRASLPEPFTPLPHQCVRVCTYSRVQCILTYICVLHWGGHAPPLTPEPLSPFALLMWCGARTYMLVQCVRTCIHICNTVREGMPLPRAPFPHCPPNVWGAYVYACAVGTHLHTYM